MEIQINRATNTSAQIHVLYYDDLYKSFNSCNLKIHQAKYSNFISQRRLKGPEIRLNIVHNSTGIIQFTCKL